MNADKIVVIVSTMLLTFFGLALNASVITTNSAFFLKSMAFVLTGILLLLLIVRFFKFSYIENGGFYLIAGGLVIFLLFFVLVSGKTINGASRWVFVGPVSFQVSEIAKLYVVAMLSFVIYRYHKDEFVQYLAILSVFLIAILIYFEPDLGMAIFILVVSGLMLTVAGLMDMKKIKILVIFSLVIMGVVLISYIVSSSVRKKVNTMLSYQTKRVERFVNKISGKTKDQPLVLNSASEQSLMVKQAIENATWLGSGFSQGSYTKYLPAKHNDYISVLALEESGIVGVLMLGLLFLIMFFAIMRISFNAESVFVHYVTLGIGFTVFLQAFFHFGVNFQVLPEKGISLPFVSYGGSSYLTNMLMIGLVLKARVKG